MNAAMVIGFIIAIFGVVLMLVGLVYEMLRNG